MTARAPDEPRPATGAVPGPGASVVGGRPRVVVVGAGFAGLAACDALGGLPVEVVLVDRHVYNTFQPLLYEVATAGLNPGDIAFPIRSFTKTHENVAFRCATVVGLDAAGSTVELSDGDSIAFDFLVVAIGAATHFFGVPGAEEHAHGIYTMEDALAVRGELSARLERAAVHGAEHGELTIVIVGGGPTGVEMAGTMAELRDVMFKTTYREIDPDSARIVLVEQRDRLLGAFDSSLSDYACRELAGRGVEIRFGTTVREVAADRVLVTSGGADEEIGCGTVIWAAGVGPTALAEALDLPSSRGRIEVGPDLRVAGHERIFAVGDVAAAAGAPPSGGGRPDPLPQLAQPAIQEGRHAGEQIARLVRGEPTLGFAYRDKGIMATIGRRAAVAELPQGIRLKGTAAWLAWLALHVMFLLGYRNRAAVLLSWGWRYVAWRRGPRVIAGP